MYELAQSGSIANQDIQTYLVKYCFYRQVRPISFTLVANDFAMK